MQKRLILFEGSVNTYSGYGNHSRDLCKSLFKIFPDSENEILIIPTNWGNTPHGALNPNNLEDKQILDHFIKSPQLPRQPDLYFQVALPSEFRRLGNYCIGVTAATETSLASMEFIEGANRMDLVIVPSTFTKNVLGSTRWSRKNEQSGKTEQEIRVTKPIEALFEGLDINIFKKVTPVDNVITQKLNVIPEKFNFLCCGHWLKGELGHDRKDIGSVIKVFYNTFKDREIQPGLILRLGTCSEVDKTNVLNKIREIKNQFSNVKLPSLYLINGNLTDEEMNSLYNHPKVGAMVSFTHGEAWGRPLLEFSVTGKPILASEWSGHLDFLPKSNAVLLKGQLEKIHSSAVWDYILLKESSWFRVDYDYAAIKMDMVFNHPGQFIEMGRKQANNVENFTLEKMTEKFESLLKNYYIKNNDLKIPELPILTKLNKSLEEIMKEDSNPVSKEVDVTKIEGFEEVDLSKVK